MDKLEMLNEFQPGSCDYKAGSRSGACRQARLEAA